MSVLFNYKEQHVRCWIFFIFELSWEKFKGKWCQTLLQKFILKQHLCSLSITFPFQSIFSLLLRFGTTKKIFNENAVTLFQGPTFGEDLLNIKSLCLSLYNGGTLYLLIADFFCYIKYRWRQRVCGPFVNKWQHLI